MQRRTFLTYLSSILSFFTFIPGPARSRLNSLLNPEPKLITIKSQAQRIEVQIPFIEQWGHKFISVEDFAQAMHYGIYTNDEKKKSVLYIEKDRITFTANNSFAKVNDDIIQLPLESLWYNGAVWAPIGYFVSFMSKYSVLYLGYNEPDQVISVEPTAINITGVKITEKENGTLIGIQATRSFTEKDIVLDVRNNYFHIDVYGGKVDPERFAAIAGAGIISKVEGIQLGETASLVFKLRGKFLARDLVLDEASNDFYVNLRTKETLSSAETEREKIKKELEEQRKKWLIDVIVLDAGHGGKDPGAIGYRKSREKDLVLPITLQLGKIIEQNLPEVRVVYTRRKDVFIPLWKRTKIANDVNAKLFISVHCNSNRSKKPNGFETYFLSSDKDERAKDVVLKENSAIEYEESSDQQRYEGLNFILATMLQSVNVKRSQFLATNIQLALQSKLKNLGMSNRGVKQGPFWVLVGATMPNVLVETGYISNKNEENLLLKKTTQKKIADGIYNGIKEYKNEVEKVS